MALSGITRPQLSAFDPAAAGEGSLDPMGLAALSDRLADRLVPGIRARMSRIRFVTAIAVGALASEELVDNPPMDGISTPSICFEWIAVEAFVRRLQGTTGLGIPGSLKARSVLGKGQRLTAATYLKGPAVFGFNGVYKPFAIDSRVVDSAMLPAERCAELVRAWEVDQGYDGFADAVPDSKGGRLRNQVTAAIRGALREGRCTLGPGSWIFGQLANALHPDGAERAERRYLRSLILDEAHPERAELGRLLVAVDAEQPEYLMIAAARRGSSPALRRIIDAVTAYEELAQYLDVMFAALRFQSFAHGIAPITAASCRDNPLVVRISADLPGRYQVAAERMADLGAEGGLEERLGDFALPYSPEALVGVTLAHHERVQAGKVPNGKRPWFEFYEGGWVVRPGFGTDDPPTIGGAFVHPIRVGSLRHFLEDTA